MSEVTESPKGRSEGSGRRLEYVSEIFLGERLRLPKSRMVVDEGLMKRSRGLAEFGGEIETGGRNILARVSLPTQGLPPSVAKPGEEVDRIHIESRVDLSTLGLHHVDGTRATFEGDGFTIESGPGDRKWEMDGARACARIHRKKEEEDDGLGSRFRQDRTILYIESRCNADGVTAPPKRPKPGPQGAGRSERPIGDIDRVVESRGHHVSDRYSSRVLAAIRSHVNWRSTCRRPAFPILVPVVGSSTMRVIAWASFAGSLGGTRSPVSSSTTTSLMPPTRVATTGVSQAIASRLMIPNGS